MKTLKLALLVLLTAHTVNAEASGHKGLTLLSTRLSWIAVYQSGGNAYSGVLDWTPSYFFSENFGLRLSAGATLLKNKLGTVEPVIEYQLLGSLMVNKMWAVEAGGGRQNFTNNGGNRWVASALVAHVSEKSFFLIFDHLFVGYTAAFIPTLMTHEFRAGIGAGF